MSDRGFHLFLSIDQKNPKLGSIRDRHVTVLLSAALHSDELHVDEEGGTLIDFFCYCLQLELVQIFALILI